MTVDGIPVKAEFPKGKEAHTAQDRFVLKQEITEKWTQFARRPRHCSVDGNLKGEAYGGRLRAAASARSIFRQLRPIF